LKADFITSATNPEQFPALPYPEIAFAGRSNVGKSTLINCLTGRKNFAKISNKPGKTRLINFFLINGKITFVDLPGYGYAQVSKDQKKIWRSLIESYLTNRKQLKAVVLIIDIRRNIKEQDLQLYNFARHHNINVIIIFSKIDKLSKNRVLSALELASSITSMNKDLFLLFSSLGKQHLDKIWESIIQSINL
jgi:GTP-binding protein